jgi:uncharacterized protein (TIGR00297 family)
VRNHSRRLCRYHARLADIVAPRNGIGYGHPPTMMDRLPVRAAVGLTGAAAISLAARQVRALSSSGALAATVVGGSVVAGAEMRGGGMLLAFFTSSTLLGRLPAGDHLEQRRGRERDAVQVIANGGGAAILALGSLLPWEWTRLLFTAGFGGALATATADTWATEIGSRSRARPRSILTRQPTAPGASGGVTADGLVASAVAAALIAGMASAQVASTSRRSSPRPIAIALGGFTGALVDSVLGATVQEVRFCDSCFVETEAQIHRCGTHTRVLRGVPWCDNDMVNAIATAAGATTAIILQLPSSSRGR